MPDDEDDVINSTSRYDALFQPTPPVPPLDLPGAQGRERSREIFEGVPKGSLAPTPALTPEQLAIVEAVVNRLAKIARNTNFTASLPAHTTPMFWSNNIDLSDTVTLAAAVSDYQTILEYTAPPSRYGLVNAYGFDVSGAYAYDGTIEWRFVLNGSPVQDLLDIAEHRGSMVQPAETFIVVPMQQKLQMQVRRTSAAGPSYDVAMKFKGWDWLLRKNDEGTKASITAF